MRNQLSVWLRPAIQNFEAFGPAAAQLSRFFKRCSLRGQPPTERRTTVMTTQNGGNGDATAKDAAVTTNQNRGCALSVVGVSGAIPKQFLRVADPRDAPPAYPARLGTGGGTTATGRLAAALALGRAKAVHSAGAPSDANVKNGTASIAGLPRRANGADWSAFGTQTAGAAARDETPGQASARDVPVDHSGLLSDIEHKNDSTNPGSTSDTIRVFMRRAKHELSRSAYETLTNVLRRFKANEPGVDVAQVLRVATKVLGASEKPGPHDLYCLFGAFVPSQHRHIHTKHVAALREALLAKSAADPSEASFLSKKQKTSDGNNQERATNALSRGGALGGFAAGVPGGSSALPGGASANPSTRENAHQSVPVARPPPRCVLCGNACGKPFNAKCGHCACYGCWLEHFTNCGEKKTETKCPSCHQPVLKKHLNKVFFT